MYYSALRSLYRISLSADLSSGSFFVCYFETVAVHVMAVLISAGIKCHHV